MIMGFENKITSNHVKIEGSAICGFSIVPKGELLQYVEQNGNGRFTYYHFQGGVYAIPSCLSAQNAKEMIGYVVPNVLKPDVCAIKEGDYTTYLVYRKINRGPTF